MKPADTAEMQDLRKYIRHPVDVPIEISGDPAVGGASGKTHNVSLGGLAFEVDRCLDPGAVVEIRLPTIDPPFQTRGQVSWCRQLEGGYEMGVQFLEASDAFRARMVEQVCHIEQYQKNVLEQEGRALSGHDAAREWIQKYAASFPDPRKG